MVPKQIGGVQPTLNLKCFNCYIHIPNFKMPTIKEVLQLTAIMLSLMISRILIFLLLRITVSLLDKINLINGEFCHLGWPQSLRFSLHILIPYHCFVNARVFILLYIWMASWSQFTLSMQVRGHNILYSYWFILGNTLFFQSLNFISPSAFVFRTV